MYGNYDGRRDLPEFDLYFGANLWARIAFSDDSPMSREILHIVSSSEVQICVVNVGTGIPFISVLELRPLEDRAYETGSLTLATFSREDLGSNRNQVIRFISDLHLSISILISFSGFFFFLSFFLASTL